MTNFENRNGKYKQVFEYRKHRNSAFSGRLSKLDNAESGNVLFYILIAVALLGALSFAISQNSRGSGKAISDERAKIFATELLEYSNIMGTAVTQLRLRGVDLDQMCFDDPAWGANDYDHAGCTDDFNKIFSIQGAGLNWSEAQPDAMDSAATPDNLWHIYGDNEVEDIGTTCGDAGCTELLLMADELSEPVCRALNVLTGVTTNPLAAPPTVANIGETRYIGAFSYTASIGDQPAGAALAGQKAGCFQRTSNDEYVFYKVLIAR